MDIVLIPANTRAIMSYISRYPTGKIGKGSSHSSYEKNGIEIELYFAKEEFFGAMLLYCTGTNQYNIMMRTYAKFRGMKLSQNGLFKDGKMIAGETEESIYDALGKQWKEPCKRGLFR